MSALHKALRVPKKRALSLSFVLLQKRNTASHNVAEFSSITEYLALTTATWVVSLTTLLSSLAQVPLSKLSKLPITSFSLETAGF
jgi:hypothetical protein